MRFQRVLSRIVLFVVALFAFAAGVRADTPLLQLETGGHSAPVRGLANAFDKRLVISAGYDKVIRVWDINKGETVRTMRGEIGPHDYGNIYALAASPSDKIIAVGGYMDAECPSSRCGDIRLFDYETGVLVGVLAGSHSNVILGLAFSPNGKYLASASGDNRVVVWDVASRTMEATFLLPDGAQPAKVAFLPDNKRLVSGGRDAILRMHDRDSLETKKIAELDGQIFGVAVSLDGKLTAAGGIGQRVHIFNTQSGEKLREIDNGTGIAVLAFGSGASIHHVATGPAGPSFSVNIFDADKGDAVARYPGHDNTVMALTFSSGGGQVYSAGGSNNAIHLWSPKDMTRARVFKGGGASIQTVGFIDAERAAIPANAVQPGQATDAARHVKEVYLGWGTADPCPGELSCPDKAGKFEYALRLPTDDDHSLGKPEKLSPDQELRRRPGALVSASLRKAVTADASMTLERIADPKWPGRFPVLKKRTAGSGEAVTLLERDEASADDNLSYHIGAGGKRIYSGGRNGELDSVDADGKHRVAFKGHANDVWSVVDSPSGRLVASGSNDQTVRLWNADTGELIVTQLYVDEENWVLWTPQGYYASSPGGDRLVGWQVNRGREQAAQFFTARNLRRHFYKPEVVTQAILRASAIEAVKELGLAKDFNLNDLDKHEKPKFRVISPRADAKLPAGRSMFKLDLSGNDNDEIEKISVFVNERKIEYTGSLDEKIEIEVPLELGSNVVRIAARNTAGLSSETVLEIQSDTGTPPPPRGKLTVIAIGVNAYPNKTVMQGGEQVPRDLEYSAADARAMLQLFADRLKGRHARTETLLLVSGAEKDETPADLKTEPTKVNIEDIFDRVRRMTADDTLVIFVAGHGINLPNDEGYVFLPTDAKYGANGWESAHLVKWQTLESALQIAKGRRYLFVDTCQSAGAVNGQLIKPLADEEVVAFMAASREQDSWEFPNLKHGVFTSSVLTGLAGDADQNKDGKITVIELGSYIVEHVQELTRGDQLPDSYRPRRDFVMMRY